MPLPTRPIDDAGPLNGKTPPILISVAVTPGASAANAGADSASNSVNANFDLPNMPSSHRGTRICPQQSGPRARRGRCDRPSSRANYSSFFELVKRFRNSRLEGLQKDPASACENASVALMASERKDPQYCLICDIIQFVEAVRDKVCSPG